MQVQRAITLLENFLSSFYEHPDWSVISPKDTYAIETLIQFAKERV